MENHIILPSGRHWNARHLEQDFHRGAAQCQARGSDRPKLFQVKITAAGRKAIAE
jgi:hypothetical protein